MGASKTYQFSKEEINFARCGRALSHPARVRIIRLLQSQTICRNTDLVTELGLVKSTVHDHIKKPVEAGFVSLEFRNNGYEVSLNDWVLCHFQRDIH